MLDLRDPESIAAWCRVHPERHGPHLAHTSRMWPRFADANEDAGCVARREVKARPPHNGRGSIAASKKVNGAAAIVVHSR